MATDRTYHSKERDAEAASLPHRCATVACARPTSFPAEQHVGLPMKARSNLQDSKPGSANTDPGDSQ
jgi:hypothetical protein